MASTTIQFGKAYFNSSSSVWSIRRQILSLPKSKVPTEIFTSPNLASSSSTIAIPLRGDSTIPSSGVYDNLKVVVFKGFNESFINSSDDNLKWSYGNNYSDSTSGQSGMNFLYKKNSSSLSSAGFQYGVVEDLVLHPLIYFSGSATLNPQENKVVTFSNPTFTEMGKKLENWWSTPASSENDFANKLYVGIYHDAAGVTWTNSSGTACDLLWTYPSLTTEQYATLTLNYGANIIKYYTGTSWQDCEVYYYNDSNWQPCEIQYYNDTGWHSIGG